MKGCSWQEVGKGPRSVHLPTPPAPEPPSPGNFEGLEVKEGDGIILHDICMCLYLSMHALRLDGPAVLLSKQKTHYRTLRSSTIRPSNGSAHPPRGHPPLPTASLFAAQVAANTLLATSGSTAAADESREVDIAVGDPHLHLGLGHGLLLSFLRRLRDRRLNARSDSPLARATFNLCCGFELTAWACNWAAALLAEAWLLVFELGMEDVEVFGWSEMRKVLVSATL